MASAVASAVAAPAQRARSFYCAAHICPVPVCVRGRGGNNLVRGSLGSVGVQRERRVCAFWSRSPLCRWSAPSAGGRLSTGAPVKGPDDGSRGPVGAEGQSWAHGPRAPKTEPGLQGPGAKNQRHGGHCRVRGLCRDPAPGSCPSSAVHWRAASGTLAHPTLPFRREESEDAPPPPPGLVLRIKQPRT